MFSVGSSVHDISSEGKKFYQNQFYSNSDFREIFIPSVYIRTVISTLYLSEKILNTNISFELCYMQLACVLSVSLFLTCSSYVIMVTMLHSNQAYYILQYSNKKSGNGNNRTISCIHTQKDERYSIVLSFSFLFHVPSGFKIGNLHFGYMQTKYTHTLQTCTLFICIYTYNSLVYICITVYQHELISYCNTCDMCCVQIILCRTSFCHHCYHQ